MISLPNSLISQKQKEEFNNWPFFDYFTLFFLMFIWSGISLFTYHAISLQELMSREKKNV